MLTDADVDDWNERFGGSLRNLAPEPWRAIARTLPAGADPPIEARIDLLTAVNLYWHDAARPTPTGQARLVASARDHVRAAMEDLHAAGVPLSIQKKLSQSYYTIDWLADDLRHLADTGAHVHRHEFVAAALVFWTRYGGTVKSSRSSGRPGGPLIRYLECVCLHVMGDNAPKPETLAAFSSKWSRIDKKLKRP